jgi:LuxR family transcriptional regulator, maltose regulon positive regulatory protein
MATSAAIAATVGSGRQTAGVGDPLLTSKVTVPSIPDWLLERPRIDRLIAAGARGSITTVTGPPGAGKTMALALWAASSPAESMTAWVTIDDHDNQPRVFWSYVLEALRRSGVPVPRALTATARRYAVDHEFLLRFASLMAAQDPPVVLVLDDAHLLTGAKVLDGLAYVLKHAAPGLRLVVASRMDPLLPLHRYRLTGELTEVRASDLAFTVPESCRLVAQHGVGLSAESLDSLTRRAEGWAAVLRLAAISMGGHPDPDQFVKELVAEDSAVAGYLVEEVLNVQPPPVRTFLLRTSILDRISEELAAEVAGEGSDAAVLPDLAHVNALVQRDDGGWYHYHSLFAAVLRLKLRREDPGRLQELHLRAARWLRRNGYLADAVRHAASAGDWELAARTVVDELAIGELIEPEGSEALADGFRDMPRDLRWTTPQPLLVASAIDLVRGEGALSGAFVCAAEDMLGRLPAETETPSRLAAALIRIALARRSGNLTAAAAAAGAAQSLIDAIPQDQHARHPWNQSKVVAGRGAVELWSGRFDDAAAIFTTGAITARMPRAGYDRADFLGHLALIEALQGRLAHAEELATESAGRCGEDTGPSPSPGSAAAEVALASVHVDRNELAPAHRWQKRAEEALHARPDKLLGVAAGLVAARQSLAEGRGKAALELASRARTSWSPPAWLEHRMLLLESWAYTATADFEPAVETAMRAGPESSLGATVALAHALLSSGDRPGAARALASAPAGNDETIGTRLAAWLVDAQLSYANDDHVRARRSLEHALRLGEPEQFRLPFALERDWLRPVLHRDPELAQQYRRLLEPDLVRPGWMEARQRPGQAAPMIVESLSEREREVLEHVSAMESTAEIATEMYISVNTVKTHLKSIYRKLAVTHRGEAVRRARKLGLL